MAKRNDNEEEKKKGVSLPKLAATLGVGYLAYTNRNAITKKVKGFLSDTTVSLSRAANGTKFKGTISELSNLSNAAVDAYGPLTPKNMYRNMMDSETRKEMLNKNLASYNKGMKARLDLSSPKDVIKGSEQLAKSNNFLAKKEASLLNMKEIAGSKKYKDMFGDKLEDVMQVFQENTDLITKDPLRGIGRVKDAKGVNKNIDSSNINFIKTYNKYTDPTKTSIDLSRNIKTDKEQIEFVTNMTQFADEIHKKTKTQMDEVTSAFAPGGGVSKISKGNNYYQQKTLYDVGSYDGLRKEKAKESKSSFVKMMTENGYKPVSMGQASSLKVDKKNGKLYAVSADTESKTARETISELYTPKTPEKTATNRLGKDASTSKKDFANRYMEQGVKFGIEKDNIAADIFSNRLFLHPKTNEIIDISGMQGLAEKMGDVFQDNLQVPVIRKNPLDLAQRRSRKINASAPSSSVLPSGSVLPLIEQSKLSTTISSDLKNRKADSHPTNKAYMNVHDKVIDSSMGKIFDELAPADAYAAYQKRLSDFVVEDNVRMLNKDTGLARNYAENMSGRTNIEIDKQPTGFKKLLGLGQENESMFGRINRAINKFDDPYYAENIVDFIADGTTRPLDSFGVEEGMDRYYANLYGTTKDFSVNTRESVYGTISDLINKENPGVDSIDLFDMSTEDGVFSVAEKLSASFQNKNKDPNKVMDTKGKIRLSLESEINQTFTGRYSDSPASFGDSKRFLKNRSIYRNDLIDTFAEGEGVGVSATDDLRKLIEQYGVSLADEKGVNLTESVVAAKGVFKQDALEEIGTIRALSQSGYFNKQAQRANTVEELVENRTAWNEFYSSNAEDVDGLKVAIRKADPAFGTGAGERIDKLVPGSSFTPVKEHQSLLSSINEQIGKAAYDLPEGQSEGIADAMAVAKGIYEWGSGASTFVAGKGGNITDASIFPWFMANRLDSPLQDLGLGLPNHLKSSAGSILFNQWTRRIVLPYAAFQTAVYIDGMTGDTVSDTAADTYVNMHKDVSAAKELVGLNTYGRQRDKMMPWLDQVKEIPGVKAFNFATLGLFSDSRSGEDVEDYYTSGEDAVRKGRYWGVGSNSAWMGNKIDRYEPNWYRKAKSDYQFSENMYGSEKEYWANNWMPTLTNPLAPIKHFITDPYHYENKHEDSRPFAVTGGFSELNDIPLVGPVVDSVVSGVLKPQRKNPRLKKAHEEYLSQYNERLSAAYINMNAAGTVNIGSGGGITLRSDAFNVGFKDEDGFLDEEALVADEMSYNAERDRMAIGLMNSTGVTPSLPGGTMLVKGMGSPEQTAELEETYGKGNVAGVGVAGRGKGQGSATASYLLGQMNARLTDAKSTSRSDQVSKAGTLGDPGRLQDLSQAISLNTLSDPQGPARDVLYNAGEIAGMYGFLGKAAAGFEESSRGTILQSSEQFGSYQKAFWDKELGGLGGDLSEIGRRYLPRDPNRDYYNPIRNEMPTWLPGPGYFTDFLHGDPYARIAHGEMRLPGEAYEKLYNVRKDEAGNYSALDRYRILADVAPYSDQYRAAKKEVSLLNSNGMLDEGQLKEYKQIREQVTSKMKKKNFYEERFQNAEVNMEKVTVSKIIDQNTFLTEEYGENPLKLAGVSVKSTDETNKELISQFVKVGQKLEVGLDADPRNRIRDDMMNTMRAVVYTPHSAKGAKFGLQGLGANQNLNYYLSKQSEEEGGTVGIKDDGSATATAALFSEGQLSSGKMMEKMVHDVLPNVPVVNIFADKFLQVRSPVEAYQKELYSKSWRDWKNPISDWVMPMLESTAKRSPVTSVLNGIGIGLMFGRAGRKWNLAMGVGTAFGVLSSTRTFLDAGREILPGEKDAWIPKRRQEQREVDEYFDKIKYVKYHGLYEKAKADALRIEGTDLDQMFDEQKERGNSNKNLSSYLKHKKKWLTIKKKTDGKSALLEQQLEEIKIQLGEIDEDRPTGKVGPYAALALRYKDEFESTLYGAGETFDYNKIYRALPSNDKQYFTAFQKASPRERQKILKLVPKNQKRIYQQQFGLKMDKEEDLDKYFDKHNLPSQNWEGWDQNTSLDNIKVKVMKNEGVELTEANYWDDDLKRSEESNVEAIDIKRPRMSSMINQGALEKALRGAGLKDVRISMEVGQSDVTSFDTDIDIQKDRTIEVEEGLKEYANQM